MITAISFQFGYNKKYLNQQIQKVFPLGERYTTELEQFIQDDITFLQSIHSLIADLNSDLRTTKITEKIKQHIGGHEPRITNYTKTRRSYFIGGLTIHEQDGFTVPYITKEYFDLIRYKLENSDGFVTVNVSDKQEWISEFRKAFPTIKSIELTSTDKPNVYHVTANI